MKEALTRSLCGAALTLAMTAVFAPVDAQQTNPPKFSTEELARRKLERRAVDAAIWGIPIVSLDAMRQAYFRDGKATYGSVDIYIGPKAPAGQEPNWIYKPEGKGWFPWFRFYGPEKAHFDKSWKMPDIERVI